MLLEHGIYVYIIIAEVRSRSFVIHWGKVSSYSGNGTKEKKKNSKQVMYGLALIFFFLTFLLYPTFYFFLFLLIIYFLPFT